MSGKAKLYLGLFIVVALAMGTMFVLSIDRRSDKEMIFEALNESIEASKEGRPGGVLDFLSDDLKVVGVENISKSYIASLIRDSKPEVKVDSGELTMLPDGETAELVSDVHVRANVRQFSFAQQFDETFRGTRMVFKKESGRKFLFFPTKVWRLFEVDLAEGAELIERY